MTSSKTSSCDGFETSTIGPLAPPLAISECDFCVARRETSPPPSQLIYPAMAHTSSPTPVLKAWCLRIPWSTLSISAPARTGVLGSAGWSRRRCLFSIWRTAVVWFGAVVPWFGGLHRSGLPGCHRIDDLPVGPQCVTFVNHAPHCGPHASNPKMRIMVSPLFRCIYARYAI